MPPEHQRQFSGAPDQDDLPAADRAIGPDERPSKIGDPASWRPSSASLSVIGPALG
jgi:hypothetical protein